MTDLLLDIIAHITSALDLDEACEHILDGLDQLVAPDRAAVMIREREGVAAVLGAVRNWETPPPSLYASFDSPITRQHHSSQLTIPLAFETYQIGVIYAEGNFGKVDAEQIDVFARFGGIAIHNARRFEQVKGYLQVSQHELLRLGIEIDYQAVAARVEEITNKPLFSRLQGMKKVRGESGDDE